MVYLRLLSLVVGLPPSAIAARQKASETGAIMERERVLAGMCASAIRFLHKTLAPGEKAPRNVTSNNE